MNINILKKRLALLCALLATIASASSADLLQPYRLVDGHTAGVLPRGYFDAELRTYSARGGYGSGLVMSTHVGITNRFTIGLSYGGEGLIGYGDNVRWFEYPGVMLKYRLFDEKFVTPALTVGFDNQGYGGPAGIGEFGYSGYIFKSPGFFAALSKNYVMLNTAQIGFHGTATYSLEERRDVTWLNLIGGIDVGVNDELVFVLEYDLAGNDITGPGNTNKYFLPHRGFLNMGLRWAFSDNFHVQFDVKDIFENKTRITGRAADGSVVGRTPIGWSRELKVIYATKF